MSTSLKRAVLAQLKRELSALGFRFDWKTNWFFRAETDRTERLHLQFISERPGYRIKLAVGVRFECVERLFHRTSGFTPDSHTSTATVGRPLEEISEQGAWIRVRSEGDVSEAVSQIMAIVRTRAIPYFSLFPDLRSVDDALNTAPHTPSAHRPGGWFRASTGLIIARLLDRDDYAELESIYREQVRQDNQGFYLPWFEALTEDLKAAKSADLHASCS